MPVQDSALTSDRSGPAARDPAEAGGPLTIDLAAIAPGKCSAVIKADACGCGIEPVAAKLLKAGCRTFFVADLAEARRTRAVARDATIYVLNGILPGTASAFAKDNLRPVINSPA